MSRISETRQVELVCPCCGSHSFIWRKAGKLKEPNHRKRLWCPVCKEDKNFVERRNA